MNSKNEVGGEKITILLIVGKLSCKYSTSGCPSFLRAVKTMRFVHRLEEVWVSGTKRC